MAATPLAPLSIAVGKHPKDSSHFVPLICHDQDALTVQRGSVDALLLPPTLCVNTTQLPRCRQDPGVNINAGAA